MSANNNNGLEDFARDLERIAGKVADKQVLRKVLSAGAKPVVDRAKRTIRQHRRTGTLDQGITTEFDEKTEKQRIGWGRRAFYGRFYESGYRPITGNRKRVGGRWRWKNKRPSGRTIQRAHIRPAYAAERQTVGNKMIETLRNELGGV